MLRAAAKLAPAPARLPPVLARTAHTTGIHPSSLLHGIASSVRSRFLSSTTSAKPVGAATCVSCNKSSRRSLHSSSASLNTRPSPAEYTAAAASIEQEPEQDPQRELKEMEVDSNAGSGAVSGGAAKVIDGNAIAKSVSFDRPGRTANSPRSRLAASGHSMERRDARGGDPANTCKLF